jgi:beta-galactosidase/beta-glucuronidase
MHFGAVDYRATVWVNGIQVAEHEGGHTPFSADIESALRVGENLVVVRAEDPGRDPSIPRGKQHWKEESEGIFYTRTTGIWQTVWLEPLPMAYIEGVQMTPKLDEGALLLAVDASHVEVGSSLGCRVVRDGIAVAEFQRQLDGTCEFRLELSQPVERWEPGNPRLYDLTLELRGPNDACLDQILTYFGMRSVEARDSQVLLNGEPLYQRLVLDQGYFPGGLLTAPTDRDLRRDIDLAQAIGFNGARKHQKIEDPRWLTWADRLGFLVWAEMANAHDFTSESAERTRREWLDVLRRDYNHPSIIAWVPVNESWGTPKLSSDPVQVAHVAQLAELTRRVDASRLVISNEDGTVLMARYRSVDSAISERPAGPALFALGYRYQGEPIIVSEMAGLALAGSASGGWGYATATDSEDFLRRYERMVKALTRSPVVRGFCVTQLTDIEQEVNGLLTAERKPKVDLDRIRAITLDDGTAEVAT